MWIKMESKHGWPMFAYINIITSCVWMLNVHLVSGAVDPAAVERTANSVEIQFYLLKQSKWSAVEEDFKEAVSDGMSIYCQTNYIECGLGSWDSAYKFTSSEVTVSDVESLKYYLNVTYYVTYHPNVPSYETNVTEYAVNKAAVIQALTESREDVNKAVGYDIVAVGDDAYSPAPNTAVDIIIIPIAVGILLILIIITVVLFYWRARQDKFDKRESRMNRRKDKRRKKTDDKAVKKLQAERSNPTSNKPPSRVYPAPHDDVEAGEKRPESQSRDRGRSAHRGDGDSFGGYHTEETILNLPDTHGHASLPPLGGDKNDQRKKHKKHKKHRSHKKDDDNRQELRQQSVMFQDSDSDFQGTQGQYRTRTDENLPPPAQYHKQTYERNDSDTYKSGTHPIK